MTTSHSEITVARPTASQCVSCCWEPDYGALSSPVTGVYKPTEPWRPVGRHMLDFIVSWGDFFLFYLSRLAVLTFWKGT